MRRRTYSFIVAVAALSLGGIGWACADPGCDASMSMALSSRGYCEGNMALLAPGNDTRANMLLLLLDRAAPDRAAHDVTAPVFSWDEMKASYLDPMPVNDSPVYTREPTARCRSNSAGIAVFTAAITAEREVTAVERAALIAARTHIAEDCDTSVQSGEATVSSPPPLSLPPMTSRAGQGFAAYLAATRDFYTGNFVDAERGFTNMAPANSAWLREVRLYMVARAALNAMQVGAFDQYGYFDEHKPVTLSAAQPVEDALNAYLIAYPHGQYAASAKGLLRRVYWFSGQRQKLARAYEQLLGRRPASVPDMIATSEEIDLKLLTGPMVREISDPILLATMDLTRMRSPIPDDSDIFQNPNCCRSPLTRGELEGQRSHFIGHEALFELLLASYAYYIEHEPREVLRLIPDAARGTGYNHLQFSRQMLRGLALEAAHDRNALGFWHELIGGAGAGHQRQGIELAIALHHERDGSVEQVFAANSPVRVAYMREILVMNSAGPALLRRLATDQNIAPRERDMALFTLLYKRLTRGEYAAFGSDVALAPAAGEEVPIELRWAQRIDNGFFNGTASDPHFTCPRLPETVARLARNSTDVRARMCLAEFMRISDFDRNPLWNRDYEPIDEQTAWPPALGQAPSSYPRGQYSRLDTYRAVIANRAASADDRAYALYRALYCYARSGYNSCGGVEADVTQRGAWFRQLKRDYPRSHWARDLEIYW
ncbi:MAG: hypothetical protein AABZ45_10610 [Pseudomonadota bacterium]